MSKFIHLEKSDLIKGDRGNLCLFYDTCAQYQKDEIIKEHWHYWVELKYVIAGTITIQTPQEQLIIREGTAILIGSRKPHLQILQEGYLRVQNLYVNIGFVMEHFSTAMLTENIFLIEPMEDFEQQFKETIRFIAYDDEINKTRFKANLMLLLAMLVQQVEDSNQIKHIIKHDALKAIMKYINLNYQQKLSLITIAEEFHYTPQYISSLFKKNYRMTFYDYLTSVRLARAKLLLVSSNIKVIDIAYECGFSNDNIFIITFKKHFGITPQAYRKQKRKDKDWGVPKIADL